MMLERLVRSRMPGIELHHLPIVLSADVGDVGKFRWSKLFRLLPIVVRMIYARIVHGAEILYYAPAMATRLSILRDFAILIPTRFLFPKTVFHFHAGGHGALYEQLPRWQRWLFRRAYFHVDAAIRLTDLASQEGRAVCARHEYIVPNGIEDPGVGVSSRAATSPVNEDRPLEVLYVGMLSESKGLMVLFEACATLAARRVPLRLNIMGRFESEEFEARARARIAELKLDRSICFLGQRTGAEKFASFAQADVLCHPSFFETFGLVLVEAMACGLPVVATRCGSIPTIVDEGGTGFLVEPRDADGLADRLARLAKDARLRQWMGAAARRRFLQEYTLERHIERMRQVFLDVASAADDPAPAPCNDAADLMMHAS
jgi:glycosyltransferase involved in cell wall biosynthesis